ncbi:hypothetical protein E3N88_14350 [Mikania micrantha]|uniref:CCHC-type domain-containing protein n=1 Tax=Mikania micrantha TaxID=192012 RepID=A0A5N6P157_9ASTR|nr:hypothetical protein E3N88_14350 [Mikania micrantha]
MQREQHPPQHFNEEDYKDDIMSLLSQNNSSFDDVAPKFVRNKHDSNGPPSISSRGPPSFGSISEYRKKYYDDGPPSKRSIEKNSSFVGRMPSSFGSYNASRRDSYNISGPGYYNLSEPGNDNVSRPELSMDVPMLSPIDMTRKSHPNEKNFMLHPFFTMKRLDQYMHAPNEELLAQVAKSHYEENKLDDVINSDLRKQMDQESLNIFSKTAYHCLNDKRAQRPNIDQVLRNLEKALDVQKKRDNPEDPKVTGEVDVATSNHLKYGSGWLLTSGKSQLFVEFVGQAIEEQAFQAVGRDDERFNNRGRGFGLGGPRGRGRGRGRGFGRGRGSVQCYNCNRFGHVRSECWNEPQVHAAVENEDEEDEYRLFMAVGTITSWHSCESCALGKQVKKPFPKGSLRATRVLELIHADLCGPMSVKSLGEKSTKYLTRGSDNTYLATLCFFFQGGHLEHLRIPYIDIKAATKNFTQTRLGSGTFATVYRAELEVPIEEKSTGEIYKKWRTVAIKCIKEVEQAKEGFNAEIELLTSCKHPNVGNNEGIADAARQSFKDGTIYEMVDPKIMEEVDELTSSLHKGPNKDSLKAYIEIAHECVAIAQNDRPTTQQIIEKLQNASSLQSAPHRHLRRHLCHWYSPSSSSSSAVSASPPASFSHFAIHRKGEEASHRLCRGEEAVRLRRSSQRRPLPLVVVAPVFGRRRRQSLWSSMERCDGATVERQCLAYERDERPTAKQVLEQLQKSLEFQEDHEIWGPKLPYDYEEILKLCKSYSFSEKKKQLYDMFRKGILLQDDKVCFSVGCNGERNAMISATTFSYRNRIPHDKWYIIPESRFQKVAKMLDISNLMIKIKTRTHLLSPNTVYGVHLVFKFCDYSTNVSTNPMHVDLKYKMGSKTLHAYFAKWRDDQWMIIELYRFLNENKEDGVVFKFLLHSLSPYYRKEHDGGHDETAENPKEIKQVVKSNLNHVNQDLQLPIQSEEILGRSENYEEGGKMFWLSHEVNGKKHFMLSAKAVLHNNSNLKLFKPLADSRFQEVIELQPQLTFLRISCMIKSQMLSQDTEYVCYLVFKLSRKCRGLRCPVEIRDLLHENKAPKIVYFRSPRPWNVIHHITWLPKQRKDGWMEVNVWNFNSNQLKNDCVLVNLKLISYEGCMSGLTVCGLEVRPT